MFQFPTFLAASGGIGDTVDNIVRTFNLNLPMFASQCVSFFIVVLLLKKFAFGPILNMLELRSKRIEEGEEKLKRIEKQLAESEESTKIVLAEANSQAQRLIDESKESAAHINEQATQKALAEAAQIKERAQKDAENQVQQMRAELKQEFGRLVAATTTQVTGKVLTDADQDRINKEALASVEG